MGNTYTLRDVMRLSHPQGVDKRVGNFILRGEISEDAPAILVGFRRIQAAQSVKEVLAVLAEHKNLSWETIPTQFLKDPAVWKALFANGQLKGQALVRNVTRLARNGAFDDLQFAGDYAKALTDESMITKTRLHPIQYLNASVVYSGGQVNRRNDYGWYNYGSRSKDWTTKAVISDALDEGFHLAFKHVEPANKRTLIGLDISGSMGQLASGLDLSCAQVGAAVAMTVARTEPYYDVRGFSTQFIDLGITPRQSFSTVLDRVSNKTFGGTDCALPMVWAKKNKVEIDTFVVITDNETWAGRVKPVDALKQYRQAMGINARLAVLAVAGTEFTIADPEDSGMMDFAGFDSNAPRALADFSAGRI